MKCPYCKGTGEVKAPTVGQQITFYRLRAELSIESLAGVTNIPVATLWRYEAGQTPKIPLDRAQRLARALGVTLDELVGT